MILMNVKLKTTLSLDQVLEVAHERLPQFRAIPGLVQKYYVSHGPGVVGGVYLWDSRESLAAFRETELSKTIAAAYKVTEPPQIEISEVLFPLRDL